MENKSVDICNDMESSQGFNCDQCDRNYKTDQGLKIHVGKAHKSEDEPEHFREYGKDKSLELSLPAEDRDDRTNHLGNSTLKSDEEKNEVVKINETTKKKTDLYPKKEDFPHCQKCC